MVFTAASAQGAAGQNSAYSASGRAFSCSMGVSPMCITGISPVEAGPKPALSEAKGWPCDSWAGRPCYLCSSWIARLAHWAFVS
jgi:hypothetical protein